MTTQNEARKNAIEKLVSLSRPRSRQRLPTFVAFLVLFFGLLSTLIISQIELRHIDRENRQHFERLVDRVRADVPWFQTSWRKLGLWTPKR